MWLLKMMMCFLLLALCTYLGRLVASKYGKRVRELKEMKSVLNLVETKIKFTYEPLGEILKELSSQFSHNVSNILMKTCQNMKQCSVGKAWELALETENSYILKEDKEILKTWGRMLGKTDIAGQVQQIEQTAEFLNYQIEKAETACHKNEKLYRTLGVVIGAAFVILLW